MRADDGTPIALGYHTGHWEVGLLVKAAAEELEPAGLHAVRRVLHRPVRRPHAGHARHDATACPTATTRRMVLRRLIRSLPTRAGVLGVATCDKGLPAMMMALAGDARPAVRAGARRRDAAADRRRGRRQGADDRRPLRPRRDHAGTGGRGRAAAPAPVPAAAASSWAPRPRRRSSARRWACRCRTRPWRPSGQPIWLDMARRSARALVAPGRPRHHDASTSSPTRRSATRWPSTRRSAARPTCCCTSRPIAYHAGLRRPTVDDWTDVNRRVPRLVDALPNGPVGHPTVRVFLAGGVPEVMLHLRELGPARPRRA